MQTDNENLNTIVEHISINGCDNTNCCKDLLNDENNKKILYNLINEFNSEFSNTPQKKEINSLRDSFLSNFLSLQNLENKLDYRLPFIGSVCMFLFCYVLKIKKDKIYRFKSFAQLNLTTLPPSHQLKNKASNNNNNEIKEKVISWLIQKSIQVGEEKALRIYKRKQINGEIKKKYRRNQHCLISNLLQQTRIILGIY